MFKATMGLLLMFSSIAHAANVPSMHKGMSVSVSGFESVDKSTHMIAWLGKGKNFREFVVQDAEAELYAQDKGAQLLSVNCKSTPQYETHALPQNDRTSKAILSKFSVTFPLAIRVRASNGKVWRLDVNHNYLATDLDKPGQHKLTLNFGIVDQHAE